MQIIFLRHGETFWNIEKKFQGQSNLSMLTENGIEQAKQAAEKLKDYDYEAIISSPLHRTIETANEINIYHKKEIYTDDRLLERGYGLLEGKSAYDSKYTIQELWDYEKNISDKEIEPVQVFFKRVYSFFDDLINKNSYERIMIVSHSGVGIALRTYFDGFPTNNDLLKLGIKNCETLEYIVKN